MGRRIVFMFSGQGSQYYKMGDELYRNHPGFRRHMDRCEAIARPLLLGSITEILYRGKGKGDPFERLLHTNPSLLAIQYSLAQVLTESGMPPDYLLGYSLGEITAAAVSGMMDLEDAFRLVIGMARLVEEKTPPAEMMAILDAPEILEGFPALPPDCWITGTNFANHFVMAGLPGSMGELARMLAGGNHVFQKLPVKHGFHTRLIDPIAAEFRALAAGFTLRRAGIPIVSSSRRWVLREPDTDFFWQIIRNPVEFDLTVQGFLETGDFLFIDVGPSGTLATFLKYLLPPGSRSVALQMMNQFGKDLSSLEKLNGTLGELAENTVKTIGRN
ncbi:MAG TPA: acyltransferase domain-containing protein [Fibrobacteria bacterium]|nr:acyltransferase domain-containing protein [Fibrobacteria bacterium]